VTPWVAGTVLGLVAGYGLLVLTGTPVRQVLARLRALLRRPVPGPAAGEVSVP